MSTGTLEGVEQPRRTDDFVVRTIAEHADALLRTARRYSLCADDAHEAYQRTMEIFLRRADSLDPGGVKSWLMTVTKNEAHAVRQGRLRLVGSDHLNPESEDIHLPGPEERFFGMEDAQRAAEALQRLKPDQVRAMWLRSLGRSYHQICLETGWTYTKVNRCLAEGRESFLSRFAGIETGAECERWAPALCALVDGEATREQRAELRPHLRNCQRCRATVKALRSATPQLAAVFPAIGIAVAAGPAAGDGAGFALRSYETVAHFLHDKATASALKLQGALDAIGAGKAAAVAASAAAVAGGGAAVVEHQVRDERPAKVRQAAPRPPAAASTAAGTTPAAAAASGRKPARVQVVRRSKPTRSKRAGGEFTGGNPSGEFSVRRAAPSATSALATPSSKPSPSRAGAEFGF